MNYRITKMLPMFLLLAALTFIYSCKDTIETEPQPQPEVELSEEETIEMLKEQLVNYQRESQFTEVEQMDGKTPLDYYREWEENQDNRTVPLSSCETPPDCPKQTVTGVFNFNAGCDIEYSYDLYNCGSGNVAIFNYTMAPVVGSNCNAYNFLVTQNLNSGDLLQYQQYYNVFTTILLSDIEDSIFPFASSTGQTLIASYLPNICSVQCASDGTREKCGDDCCIRFAIYDNANQTRMQFVFSAGECGGDIVDICNFVPLECVNQNCIDLGGYY